MTIKRPLRRPDEKSSADQGGLTAFEAKRISQISRVSQETGEIESVVLIPNVEVGLDDPNFQSNLTLPRGNIKLENGNIQFSDGSTLSTATAASGAPNDAQYIVISSDSSLTNERVFADGSGITTVDGGAGQSFTVSFDANDLSALGATVSTSDYVVIYDSDASTSKKALVSNLPFTNNTGDITSVVAGNGTTGGGTSGDVTITVQAADSTISVGSGGISVDESNLSSIPNGALSNNTISGVSLGSNLNNLTIGNGVQLNTGTTYNGSSAVTLSVQASDSTISVGSGGISVDESNLSSIPNSGLSNSTISGVSLGSNLNSLTIGNGVQLDSGATYNGSSAVSLSVQAADSTISVGSGGISVSESNLSSIPNSSLSNSTISGISLGSNLNNLTVSTGLGLDSGSTYNGSSARTITNTGVTQITAGSGISISGGTGNVTVTASGAQTSPVSMIISVSGATLLGSNSASATISFDTSTSTDSNVISAENNGVFTAASTGTYKISGFVIAESNSQSRSNVKIRFKFTDGSNSSTTYESATVTTLTTNSVRIGIEAAYFTFTDANTRAIQMDMLANSDPGNITSANDLGFPYGLIEITKLS